VSSTIQAAWQRRSALAIALLPLALVFLLLSALRRLLYRSGLLRSHRLPVPVIIIGNVSVGGTGKTPICIWLADALRRRGRRPGIISRGYGGQSEDVCEVGDDADPLRVGDEPALLRRRSGCPTFVGRDRVAAARALLRSFPDCDVLISDDGLQHYRLRRDVELAVMDGRGTGNGWVLPAGPLREPVSRLNQVDAVILNGDAPLPRQVARVFSARMEGAGFYRLDAPETRCNSADLAGLRLHACAGIGVPERFFAHLRRLGLGFAPHPFPDHHRYAAADLTYADCDALLMTEKDAIKCVGLTACPIWVLPVTAVLDDAAADYILEKIDGSPPA
jgi:tetraacyldisaccharide 4'-kinase